MAMLTVTFFGTSGARSYAERDNTYLGVRIGESAYIVDCGGAPVQRAERCGFPWRELDGVILTHLHPDHWYGLPSLIHNLRLIERTRPLPIYCPAGDVGTVESLLRLYEFVDKPEYMPLPVVGVPLSFRETVVEKPDHRIEAFAVRHSVDCMGIAFHSLNPARTVVYSSDTWRSESLLAAAMDADLLIHEASGLDERLEQLRDGGHSTAGEAGRIAARCRAKALCMIHCYRESEEQIQEFLREARAEYDGPVRFAGELETITID